MLKSPLELSAARILLDVQAPVVVPVIGPARDEVWSGTGGDDNHAGTNGDDTLDGLGGNDTLNGKGGVDNITGGAGDDNLKGGDGNDFLRGGADDDKLNGGEGTDYAVFDTAASAVQASLASGKAKGGDGNDKMSAIEGLMGSAFNDKLTGNELNNHFHGLGGNDRIDGGDGIDSVRYTTLSSGTSVTVDLVAQTATGTHGTDTLKDIESAWGGGGHDTLIGNKFANVLMGGDGNDTIVGGKGNDGLYGGNGADTITSGPGLPNISGGAGSDTFIFAALDGSAPYTHYISDAQAGETLDFSPIDAIKGGVDQAFIVVIEFNGAPGEAIIEYNSSADQTYIFCDVDGGPNPEWDFALVMAGDRLTSNQGDPPTTDLNIIW
jgi:Ca2+-binding RTX toxin-like protein